MIWPAPGAVDQPKSASRKPLLGGGGADQHLVRARLADLDILDLKRLAHLAQDGCLHLTSPFFRLERPPRAGLSMAYRRSETASPSGFES